MLIFCVRRQDDRTIGVRVSMPKSDGFRSWSEDDIAAFEAVYPSVGSKAPVRLGAAVQPSVATPPDVVRAEIRLPRQRSGPNVDPQFVLRHAW